VTVSVSDKVPGGAKTQDRGSVREVDVTIIGGGLAGLTLAIQVRQACPDVSIVVLERQPHPVPVSAHKIGESTVEIGAHYLAKTIGLDQHLKQEHLKKFGLRLFFGGHGQADPARRLHQLDEIGASYPLPALSYQLDRGILENHMGLLLGEHGIEFLDAHVVRQIQLDENGGRHRVTAHGPERERQFLTRWVIDAGSRGGPLRRKLTLAQPSPLKNHAAWFRLEDRIDVESLESEREWLSRCQPGKRWLSTNHFMGPGYWIWIIPLAPGHTSVGAVADSSMHEYGKFATYESTLAWIAANNPVASNIVQPASKGLMDFTRLRNFSHDAKQLFSANRWAMTGEAGVFLDPFYSPGSDFIAISNTLITKLVATDLEGQPIKRLAPGLEAVYRSFYRNSLLLYQDQYPGFGDFRLQSAKTTWDYIYYWGILCQLFFSDMVDDPGAIARTSGSLLRAQSLNRSQQQVFARVATGQDSQEPTGRFLDQCSIPSLVELNQALTAADNSPEQAMHRLSLGADLLERVAVPMQEMLKPGYSSHSTWGSEVVDCLGGLAAVR